MVMVPFECKSYTGHLMVTLEKIINNDSGNSSLIISILFKTDKEYLQIDVSFMLPPNRVQLAIHYVKIVLWQNISTFHQNKVYRLLHEKIKIKHIYIYI